MATKEVTDSANKNEEKANSLVTGYLKKQFPGSYEQLDVTPFVLLVIRFLGNIFFKFDRTFEKYKPFIYNDGTILKVPVRTSNYYKEWGCHIMFGCSNGFDEGIHYITIKCVKAGNNPIGITNMIKDCDRKDSWIHDNPEAIVYSLYPRNIYCTPKARATAKTQPLKDYMRYETGDEIKLIINCNEWKLTFFANEKQLGETMNIVKNVTYYLVICFQYWDTEYHLTSITHKR